MIIFVEVKGLLDAFLKGSIDLILDCCLNACKELVKFSLVLFLVYIFAMWSFQFWDEVLQGEYMTSIISTSVQHIKEELMNHKIGGDVYLKIEPVDVGVDIKYPSLIDQLEIEAEFEQHQAKLVRSEAELEIFYKSEIHTPPPRFKISSGNLSIEDISQIKEDFNKTSRSCQTYKTSLGKKSKNSEQLPPQYAKSNRIHTIKISQDEKVQSPDAPGTSKPNRSNGHKQQGRSYDDEDDHESFYRV